MLFSVSARAQKLENEGRTPATAITSEEAKRTIYAIAAAYNAHDAARSGSYETPDFVGMFHGFPSSVGLAADIESMKQQFLDPAVKFDLEVQRVEIPRSGEMAVVHSTYVFHFTGPRTKSVASERGNWVTGLKRQADGTLKLAWSIGADEPAASSPEASPKP